MQTADSPRGCVLISALERVPLTGNRSSGENLTFGTHRLWPMSTHLRHSALPLLGRVAGAKLSLTGQTPRPAALRPWRSFEVILPSLECSRSAKCGGNCSDVWRGWKAVTRSSRLNDAGVPYADLDPGSVTVHDADCYRFGTEFPSICGPCAECVGGFAGATQAGRVPESAVRS
jgi:hypothetical protein